MESLSIKKTGKVMLAVALVIFMLVALLGLALYGTTAAASAEGDPITITATFVGQSKTPHGDSTTTKLYYNQDGLALTVNTDTFEVNYAITNSVAYTGATLDLTNTGFSIVGVKIGDTSITNSLFVSPVTYKVTATTYEKMMYYGNIPANTTINVKVTYKLTSAIATYSHADLTIGGRADINMMSHVDVESSAAGVYVRSTAGITTSDPSKTYDSTAVTTGSTFTPAVSDAGNESRRSAIVTTWSTGSAPINAGSYNVAVSTAANDYYEATSYNTDFTIDQKPVTLTAENKSTEHGDALATLTWTGDSGFYAADGVTVSASTTATTTGETSNVGTYPITLATSADPTSGYAGLANYAITYEHAQTSGEYGVYTITRKFIAVPTVTIFNDGVTTDTTIAVAGSENVNYNGLVYSFDYAEASDNAYSGVASPAASKNFGTYVLTLTIGSNYRWGATVEAEEDLADKVFTYVVKKVDLHVSLDHDAITYRDAVPTTGYSISLPTAAVGGETVDSISLTQANFNTAYTQGSPVGTYAITLTEDSATDTAIKTAFSNYNVIYDTANKLSVGKLTVTADGTWVAYKSGDSATMTYDAAAHGIEAVATGYTFGGVEICNVALTGGDNSNGTQTHVSGNEAAVTLTATFTLKGDSAKDDYNNVITENYTLAEGVQTKNITITRKAVTIAADNKSTIYGTAAPAFTTDADSVLISGDTYTTEGSCTTAYTATAGNANRVVGTYDIVPSGWANNDYAISYTNGTLTVNKKVVTFTWSETKTWVYDAGSHTITATVVGAEYGETITVDEYSGDASAINVGNYSRTVTSLTDDDNYAITDNGTETEAYSITKATVTVTITPATSLVYNSNSQTVFTVNVSGLIGTESLTFAYTNTNLTGSSFVSKNGDNTFAGELAQDYAITVTGITDGVAGESQLAGDADNYTLSAPAVATENSIAKYTFTWAAVSYSGNVATWTAPTTIQDGDSITFAYSLKLGGVEKLASDTALTYTATETGVYTLSVTFSGDRAANYNLIADQTLLEVFSVTLNDAAYADATYGHPHNGEQIASVTQYAFDGQTVPGVSAWSVAGYQFNGWFLDYTNIATGAFDAANAVTETKVYTASWQVVTYNVTYKYKLSGADSWETYKTDVVTTYYTALETVPTITWFKNVGWNDAEEMNGATKTILDYTSDRTYYTVYTFAVGAGDVNGDKAITTADATLMSEKWVGGYDISSNVLTSIAAAWAVADQFEAGVYTFAYAPATAPYYLEMVEDVNADGALSAADAAAAAVATIDANYLGVTTETVDTFQGIVIILPAALVSEDQVITGISAAPASVKVAGEAVTATYSEGTLTLPTALTSGQTVEIIMANGAKFKYTA